MGIFDLFKHRNIDEYVAAAGDAQAKLVDVREPAEYQQGHIPDAINMPISSIASRAPELFKPADTLFLYCQSGVRSGRACSLLKAAGFANAVNIGGISSYHGQLEQ